MKNCHAVRLLSFLMILFFTTRCYCIQETPSETNTPVTRPADDPEISMFMDGINAAGMHDLFHGTGPFTGFIPTNAAFAKLEKGKWDELLKPENNSKLVEFLTSHILPGKYLSKSLKTKSYTTLSGKEITIENDNGTIKVNNAKIIRADMIGPDGVIHQIDAVLMEP